MWLLTLIQCWGLKCMKPYFRNLLYTFVTWCLGLLTVLLGAWACWLSYLVLGPADSLTLNNFTTLIILHRYREENMTAFLMDSMSVTFWTVLKYKKMDRNISSLGLSHLLLFMCLKKQKTCTCVWLFIPICYNWQELYACRINCIEHATVLIRKD